MGQDIVFSGVFPIGDTDVRALPVSDFGPAIGYYTQVLGFTVTERTDAVAILRRDAAEIGLAANGADPEQASCYFAVRGLDALREELEAKLIEPSQMRVDEHGGKQYRVFFAKEPYGVCFCFGEQLG